MPGLIHSAAKGRKVPPFAFRPLPCRQYGGAAEQMTGPSVTRVSSADSAGIEDAVRCLESGGLVAFPTETVYGLGADATNGQAVARLYAAKGRPSFNPLIAHVPDLAAAQALARFNADALRLAAALWPGPLTVVLPKASGCPVAELATAGLDTIAVRVPNHAVAQKILCAFAKPVVAPSANRSGHVSPTTAAHVLADLGDRIELIIDAGPTPVGVESTIIACLDRPTLLRPGGVPRGVIERTLGRPLADPPSGLAPAEDMPLAPGRLASHYAPRTPLRLNARHVEAGEALLGFGPVPAPGAARAACVRNLSERSDLIEAAANLFSHLRALDGAGASAIAVMPIPQEGLGEAINDRLARAAAPR
jgi:L-threonylcarbamoyladenylate synthase